MLEGMPSAQSVVSSVAASTSATPLLGASINRRGASVYYDGAASMYLLLGSGTASTSNYTAKLGDGFLTYYELPANYQGPVSAIWSSAVGSAQLTDYE